MLSSGGGRSLLFRAPASERSKTVKSTRLLAYISGRYCGPFARSRSGCCSSVTSRTSLYSHSSQQNCFLEERRILERKIKRKGELQRIEETFNCPRREITLIESSHNSHRGARMDVTSTRYIDCVYAFVIPMFCTVATVL